MKRIRLYVPLIGSAFVNTSGKRHTMAAAWKAPMEAPAVQMGMSVGLAVHADGRHDLVAHVLVVLVLHPHAVLGRCPPC
jgi:hypothetical protein